MCGDRILDVLNKRALNAFKPLAQLHVSLVDLMAYALCLLGDLDVPVGIDDLKSVTPGIENVGNLDFTAHVIGRSPADDRHLVVPGKPLHNFSHLLRKNGQVRSINNRC